MSEKSQKDPDLEEIFLHIKQLRAGLERLEDSNEQMDAVVKIVEDDDVQKTRKETESETDTNASEEPSEIVEPINEITLEAEMNIEEEFSKMKVKTDITTSNESHDIVKPVDETTDVEDTSEIGDIASTIMKPTSWRWGDTSTGICDLCKHEIVFEKNLSGLVVCDRFFACEECCKTVSKEDLMSWTKSRMVTSNDIRPIGLWTIQEKNKGRSVLFRK